MPCLDVFLTPGCPSETEMRCLAVLVSRVFTNVTVNVLSILDDPIPGLFIVPAFVLDGALIGMGPISLYQLCQAVQAGGGIRASPAEGVGTTAPDGEGPPSRIAQ